MKKGEFFYSIMSIRLPKGEANKYCEEWSRNHFLPRSRFEVVCEHGHYRVVCKVYEHELYRFGYKRLCDRRRTLDRHTKKVTVWLKKQNRHRREAR